MSLLPQVQLMISLKTVAKKQHNSRGAAPVTALLLLLLGVHDLHACESASPRLFTDLLTNMDVSGAESYLQAWEQRELKSADIGFYRAMLTLAKAKASSGERRERLRQQALDKLLNWVRESAKSSKNLPSTLTIGMAKAFIARIYLDQERWFKAYRYGSAGRDELRALVERKPDSEDANLVLGLYEFYSGSVPAGLRGLMALIDLSGDRDKGLRYLERAVAHAPIAAPEAARILIYELPLTAPEVCAYLPLLKEVRQRYPKNPLFTLRLQRVYRECGYPLQALEENRRAEKHFQSNHWLKRKLDWEALHIHRDLGNVEAIKLLRTQFRDASQIWSMAKAGALDVLGKHRQAETIYRQVGVEGKRDSFSGFSEKVARYKPPPRVANAKQILSGDACPDGG